MKKRNSILLFSVLVLVVLMVGVGYKVTRNSALAGGDGGSQQTQKPTATKPVLGALPGNESSGDFIFTGQVLAGLAVNQPIAVTPTSTLNVFTGGRDRSDTVARWTNTTGKTLICSRAAMPIISSTGTWTYSMGVGTTTRSTDGTSWSNTTTATLIASTTMANTASVFSLNSNLFTTNGNAGSYFTKSNYGTPTTTEFVLTNGTSIVGWIKTIDATSTDSFVKNDGHRLTGSLQVDCRPVRY